VPFKSTSAQQKQLQQSEAKSKADAEEQEKLAAKKQLQQQAAEEFAKQAIKYDNKAIKASIVLQKYARRHLAKKKTKKLSTLTLDHKELKIAALKNNSNIQLLYYNSYLCIFMYIFIKYF